MPSQISEEEYMSANIEKRRQAVLDIINQMGTINFAQLEQYFPNVSGATLRKDLQYLSDGRQIMRFHGGAKSMPREPSFVSRSNLHREEKKMIAAKAASLIQPAQSIFLTAGSTCAELAKQMPDYPLYLAMDGLDTAMSLRYNPSITVELLGGELDLNLMRVSGSPLLERLDRLHFNIAFLGTPSFHPRYGFSYLSEITVTCLKKAAEQSEQVVMLMDSSKLNYAFTPCNIPIEDVDVVITDDMLDEKVVSQLRERGIQVL